MIYWNRTDEMITYLSGLTAVYVQPGSGVDLLVFPPNGGVIPPGLSPEGPKLS